MEYNPKMYFGPYGFDQVNECLWRDKERITLRPKAYAVLSHLLSHPGVLVTKEQLLQVVWQDTLVSEAVLKDCIRQLREALGGSRQRLAVHTDSSSTWLSLHR